MVIKTANNVCFFVLRFILPIPSPSRHIRNDPPLRKGTTLLSIRHRAAQLMQGIHLSSLALRQVLQRSTNFVFEVLPAQVE
jgi:hypothetical protein